MKLSVQGVLGRCHVVLQQQVPTLLIGPLIRAHSCYSWLSRGEATNGTNKHECVGALEDEAVPVKSGRIAEVQEHADAIAGGFEVVDDLRRIPGSTVAAGP